LSIAPAPPPPPNRGPSSIAVNGVSPETGTNLNPDGTPHKASRHATRITDVESYVDAQEAIRNGPEFTAELEQRMAHGPLAPGARLEVVAKLEDVFGPDYLSKVEGITRVGGKNSPTRHGVPTDLADGTIKAIYEFDASGEWTLLTLYPDPLP
jgi:hypothetical protein